MAFDEGLAQRIRDVLDRRMDLTGRIVEKKMFGGIAFMLQGNMSMGVIKEDMVIRADKDKHESMLSLPHARPMDFTGRPMKGWVYVDAASIDDDEVFEEWVLRGIDYALSLPAK